MKKRKPDQSHAEELRRKAEERLQLEKPLPEEISPAEAQKLIHELRVYQIELEMQNDELRQTQEILEESRSRYSDLYDFAPIGYLTLDELGVIKEANLTATQLLQVERKWLIDRPFTHFMVIEDRGAFRRHLNLVIQGQERQTIEVRLKRKDEQEFFALLESAFYQDTTGRSLCRIAFSDISKRRQAEAALKESEQRYRSLFQDNNAVMLLIDPAIGDIVDANPAACAFYGFSKEELTARKITEINTLPSEQVFEEMRLAKKDKRRQFHFRHRLARGEVRDVEVFSGRLRLQGQDLLYSIIHDITARMQAEEALQRLNEELEQRVKERTEELTETVAQLQEEIKNRLQTEESLRESEAYLHHLASQLLDAQERERKRLAAELHDELGHALLTIKLQLRALERGLTPEQKTLAEDIEALHPFIDGVLNSVRRIYLDLSPGNLEDLGLTGALRQILDEFAKKHKDIHWQIRLDNLDREFPPTTQTVIYRIVQEILNNIGKHAKPSRVSVRVKRNPTAALFTMEDNGCGFDTSQIHSLDDPHRGLGLTAMEERVRMQGGTLEIISRENRGTRIAFTLPLGSGRQ